MKVVKKTGLVPVKLFTPFSTGFPGDIVGVSPAKAREMVKKKEAILVDIPEHIETIDEAGPTPDAVSVPVEEDTSHLDKVVIPDNWETIHHLKRIVIAKSLSDPLEIRDGEKPLEAADRMIRQEIERRQAKNPAPAPVDEPAAAEAEADAVDDVEEAEVVSDGIVSSRSFNAGS